MFPTKTCTKTGGMPLYYARQVSVVFLIVLVLGAGVTNGDRVLRFVLCSRDSNRGNYLTM